MPDWTDDVRRRLAGLRLSAERELEIVEELSQHLQQRYEDLGAAGASDGDARRLTLEELLEPHILAASMRPLQQANVPAPITPGGPDQSPLHDLWQDVRYAARLFRKDAGFAAAAVLTLALGIADQLVRVYGRMLDGSQERAPLSAGTIQEIRERQRSFKSLAAFVFSTGDAVYGDAEGPRVIEVGWVESAFFQTLGVSPLLGRTLQNDDAASGFVPLSGGQAAPDTARAVLLSYGGWQRLFQGDPRVLGREVRIDGIPRTIVGVLPSDFIAPTGNALFYFAMDLGPVVANPVTVRRAQWLGVVARLNPGVSHVTAQREVAAIGADLSTRYPADDGQFGIAIMPLGDAMVGDTRTPLLVVMASAGFVLLIACANLAGALLSRNLSRGKEFAVRVALGAGRRRLVRQLLAESTVLAIAGGVLGLLLAAMTLPLFRTVAVSVLPVHAKLALDFGAVMVTAVLTLCTGIGFGLAPALAAGRLEKRGALRQDARGASESRRSLRLRGAMVAAQVALCASLLVGAGLMVRSLSEMATAPLGFEPAGVLTAAVRLQPRDYPTRAELVRFLEQMVQRLALLPGVGSAASANSVPTTVRGRVSFKIDGAPAAATEPFVLFATVSDDYFRTLRIPIREGRTFDRQDRAESPPTVVISESMARQYWPGRDPLAARIRIGANPTAPPVTVVGVVGDVRNDPARPDAEPMAYAPIRQAPPRVVRILLRTTDPLGMVRTVERELALLDARLPLEQATSLEGLLDQRLSTRRLPMWLLSGFGLLALLLVSIGVYAMFTSLAAAREREFGVRLALGASRRTIARLMLRQGASWMAVGLSGGGLGTICVVRLLGPLLYGVSPFDPIVLAASVVILVGCATVAVAIPVRRATRLDPILALRAE
jgi:putative ABC transport system permease protein